MRSTANTILMHLYWKGVAALGKGMTRSDWYCDGIHCEKGIRGAGRSAREIHAPRACYNLPGIRVLYYDTFTHEEACMAATKKALVLSGGGGRGAYHVGVLEALGEQGWMED